MKYFKHILLILVICPLLIKAQPEFTPSKINGSVPSLIYEELSKTINQKIKTETVLDKKSAKHFYSSVTYNVWNILNSGKVYFDGSYTECLQNITNQLLRNKPELLKQVKVYAFKSASLNAVTYPDGHIFVNLGLIASVENEDQLAAILAHEIVHYTKEHAKQAYKKEQNLVGTGYRAGSGMASLYRYLKYSKENEQEADAVGLQLLLDSKYDASQMPSALQLLATPDTLNFTPKFDLYFNSSIFTLDSLWLDNSIDSIWAAKAKDSDEDIIDDAFSTHPDVEKRVFAVKEILQASEYKKTQSQYNEAFNNLKQLAAFENVNNLYVFARYNLSLYGTLKLMEQYPNDAFLKVNVMRCIYMLGYLKQVDKLENVLLKSGYSNEQGLNKVNAFLNKLSANDYKKMAYGYLKNNAENLKSNEEFNFYQALLTDNYLGKNAAYTYYNQYADKYPDGKYITYVKNKLKGQL